MDIKKLVELQKQLDENEKRYKETEKQIRDQLEKYKNENILNCDRVKEELNPLDLSPQQINFICSNEILYKYLIVDILNINKYDKIHRKINIEDIKKSKYAEWRKNKNLEDVKDLIVDGILINGFDSKYDMTKRTAILSENGTLYDIETTNKIDITVRNYKILFSEQENPIEYIFGKNTMSPTVFRKNYKEYKMLSNKQIESLTIYKKNVLTNYIKPLSFFRKNKPELYKYLYDNLSIHKTENEIYRITKKGLFIEGVNNIKEQKPAYMVINEYGEKYDFETGEEVDFKIEENKYVIEKSIISNIKNITQDVASAVKIKDKYMPELLFNDKYPLFNKMSRQQKKRLTLRNTEVLPSKITMDGDNLIIHNEKGEKMFMDKYGNTFDKDGKYLTFYVKDKEYVFDDDWLGYINPTKYFNGIDFNEFKIKYEEKFKELKKDSPLNNMSNEQTKRLTKRGTPVLIDILVESNTPEKHKEHMNKIEKNKFDWKTWFTENINIKGAIFIEGLDEDHNKIEKVAVLTKSGDCYMLDNGDWAEFDVKEVNGEFKYIISNTNLGTNIVRPITTPLKLLPNIFDIGVNAAKFKEIYAKELKNIETTNKIHSITDEQARRLTKRNTYVLIDELAKPNSKEEHEKLMQYIKLNELWESKGIKLEGSPIFIEGINLSTYEPITAVLSIDGNCYLLDNGQWAQFDVKEIDGKFQYVILETRGDIVKMFTPLKGGKKTHRRKQTKRRRKLTKRRY